MTTCHCDSQQLRGLRTTLRDSDLTDDRTRQLFAIWEDIRNVKDVHIDPTWTDFDDFLRWALSTGYAEGLYLVRKEMTEPFSPRNCHWVEACREDPGLSRRFLTIYGEVKSLGDWANDPRCVVPMTSLHRRIAVGWTPQAALATPAGEGDQSWRQRPHPTQKSPNNSTPFTLTAIPIGAQFGRFTVIGPFIRHFAPKGGKIIKYPCQCSCGQERLISGGSLINGNSQSCGCLRRERCQARRQVPVEEQRLRALWRKIRGTADKRACCPEWQKSYEVFREWSLTHEYAPTLYLSRVDMTLPYSADNCVWVEATVASQMRQPGIVITAFNERKPLRVWVDDPRCVVKRSTLIQRLADGWESEAALTTPVGETLPATWIAAFGEHKRMADWVDDPRCQVQQSTLSRRLSSRCDAETAITTPSGRGTKTKRQ
ncbi:MAG: hypothetical protein WCJ56_06430 [bacterium]